MNFVFIIENQVVISYIKIRYQDDMIQKETVAGEEGKCVAISHARRFGKSQAAGMIDAYYSLGSDSRELFSSFEIAKQDDFEEHLNQYNVIHLDLSSFWDFHKEDILEEVHTRVCEEFQEKFGDDLDYSNNLYLLLQKIYLLTKIPFVIIIDEWDCIIRNSNDEGLIHNYLQFLHSLFKSEESKSFLALGYLTGILPIKKVKDESALNNFSEYTMLGSKKFTKYYGFTESEIQELCKQYNMDYESTKTWYNGYLIDGIHMYNPNSVTQAMLEHQFDSYWRNTSSFDSINTYITMNYEGLKDDAVTALIHLGYLGYDADRKSAYVPNYEVATAFEMALATGAWSEIADAISRCDELLFATIDKDADQVAEIIEQAHTRLLSGRIKRLSESDPAGRDQL